MKAGFPPDKAAIMAAITMPESSGDLNAYNPKDPHGGSFGIAQINGVHPGARDTMGNLDLSMQKAFEISKGGADFTPWSGYTSGAYRSYLPTGGTGQGRTAPSMGAPPRSAQGGDTVGAGGYRYDIGSDEARAATGQAPGGQQMAQAGPQTATDAGPQDDLQAQIAKIPLPSPPDLHLDEVRRRISATGARWEDKERMLQNYIAQRGPQARAAYEQAMEQYKVNVGVAEKEWAERNKQRDRASEGGSLIERPEGTYREKGGIATPVTIAGTGQPLGPATRLGTGAAGGKTSHNVEVTDADGKVIFSGSAHQGPQGWISDKDQQSVQIPESGNIKILGTGGQGRQAAQQIQSMVGASSELVGEARNLMELPSTATAGVFQGLQGIPAAQLGDTLKRTLANKLTPEESTDLATSFQGVARSLATIEAQGRATGLVGLTGMSQGLIPQTNDTIGNIWRKYATLRQIMERNIDAIQASPNASPEQKGLLKKLRTEMESVIPFTVSDVNKMQHGDAQSFSQAAQKAGLGRGGTGGPPPEAVEALRNDKRSTAQQDFDAIFGAGAAARALGGGAVPAATPGAL
jgi:hypothetical protein